MVVWCAPHCSVMVMVIYDDGDDDGDGDDDDADDGADDGDGDGGAPESDISVFSTAFHRISCPSRETYLLRSQMLYI